MGRRSSKLCECPATRHHSTGTKRSRYPLMLPIEQTDACPVRGFLQRLCHLQFHPVSTAGCHQNPLQRARSAECAHPHAEAAADSRSSACSSPHRSGGGCRSLRHSGATAGWRLQHNRRRGIDWHPVPTNGCATCRATTRPQQPAGSGTHTDVPLRKIASLESPYVRRVPLTFSPPAAVAINATEPSHTWSTRNSPHIELPPARVRFAVAPLAR